jgi:type 1 glutamine amidotransferase/mono/diheme cytochrome c family protein/glucose/arabinose dehydrogenase
MSKSLTILSVLCLGWMSSLGAPSIPVLIVDGQNNHDWQSTTDSLHATLKATNRFAVEVETAPETKSIKGIRAPKADAPEHLKESYQNFRSVQQAAEKKNKEVDESAWKNWNPFTGQHQAVVLNYNGREWTQETKESLVRYVREGGGLVLVHAANNAFRNWDAYNEMIGLGWRPANFGDCIKWEVLKNRPFVACKDCTSGHGSKHPFQISVRKPGHPIMKGIPAKWMHGKDELYHNMRGPAKNLTILSSAYSDPKQRGTGEHEPITYEVSYGKGRVIVTTMGHFWNGQTEWDGLHCVGFQTVFARSVEYAATSKVTLPIPADFPDSEKVSVAEPFAVIWNKQVPESEHKSSNQVKKENNPYAILTPEEELETFELAPGYVAELVAAEPLVQEPVLTVWDGNGAMYVAEMRSYMQDEKGTGTKTLRNGRIKRLVDLDEDGRMDKSTIFVDDLNLPRMILPLDDWIAVRETDTMDVVAYRDTDGDGIADENKMLYKRGPYSRNGPKTSVEHQDSGMLWNVDNHIYISYNMERYQFTEGTWKAEKQPGHWTQWGLTHDDYGKLFWVDNTRPLKAAQFHPKYWKTVHRLGKNLPAGDPVSLGNSYEPLFTKATSICLTGDRGGQADPVRGFTSACGQSIYRGNKFPYDSRGAYFFCDPTIHVVRRAYVEYPDGKLMLRKAEPEGKEFFRSSDFNSRFVNTAVGPDGCLYVTDMYRGIIQDAAWFNEGNREFARRTGVNKNVQMGRIWRIRHEDHRPYRGKPRMLSESTEDLVRHLQNPVGWWRDTAQKLILLRPDREKAIPLLKGVFRFTQSPLPRMHALRTLDGMNALTPEIKREALADRSPVLRRAMVQMIEPKLPAELDLLASVEKERDSRVAEQLVFTLGTIDDPKAEEMIQSLASNHLSDKGVMLATAVSLWEKKHLPLVEQVRSKKAFVKLPEAQKASVNMDWDKAFSSWDRGMKFSKDFDVTHRKMIQTGEQLYFQHCTSCHGADGKGVQVPGTEQFLAPSLVESKRVHGPPEQLIPLFYHGLIGPIEGKTYQAGYMAPTKTFGIEREDRLADLLTYLRYAWGKEGGLVDKSTVSNIRRKHEKRSAPWTDEGLKKLR